MDDQRKFLKSILSMFCLVFFLSNTSPALAQERTTICYAVKDGDSLFLDLYYPEEMKSDSTYPALLWMHGGGFSGGRRDHPAEIKLSRFAAQKGYVGISLSYRLRRKGKSSGFGCQCPKNEKLETFRQATIDYLDAALYLVKHAKKLSIDPTRIIAGGSSAGAEAILSAAFMREFYIENPSRYQEVRFAGVFALAGAVLSVNYIDSANAVPTVLFHGTADALVPFHTAPHHFCDRSDIGYLILDGSKAIIEKLETLHTAFAFYSFLDSGHEIASIPFDNLDEVFSFFDRCILGGEVIQSMVIKQKNP